MVLTDEAERRDLRCNLRELLGYMCGASGQPSVPATILIAELAPGPGLPAVHRSQLRTPEEYSSRFAALMDSNFIWLNMQYCGTFEGHGLVLIEYPRQSALRPGRMTSVNFSGPPKLVADAGWDATAYVTVLPDVSV